MSGRHGGISAGRRSATRVFQLQLVSDGESRRIEARAVGKVVSAPAARFGDDSGAAPDSGILSLSHARALGTTVFETLLPPPVEQLWRQALDQAAGSPVVLSVAADAAPSTLELLRDPDHERFVALVPDVAVVRHVAWSEATTRPPRLGRLRVSMVTAGMDEGDLRELTEIGQDAGIELAVGTKSDGEAPSDVVDLRRATVSPEVAPHGTALVVVDSADHLPALRGRVRNVLLLPRTMDSNAQAVFLAALYRQLATGERVDRATSGARRVVADRYGVAGLDWACPVLYAGAAGPIVIPHALLSFGVTAELREHTLDWLRETTTGVLSSIGLALAGLILYRLGFSSRVRLEFQLLSPHGLYETFKGLVIALSTRQEHVLLAIGSTLALLTVLVGYLGARNRDDLPTERRGLAAQLARHLAGLRAVTFLATGSLIVLGAYGYQQYLWNVLLPIDARAMGIAVTREAAAAAVERELYDALHRQGLTEKIVIRRLPVAFDNRDTERARALGRRIHARAVLIYRPENDHGETRYTAYLVFTDPRVGIRIGAPRTEPSGAGPGHALPDDATPNVKIKEGGGVPVLRTETLTELVNAAAGIIAFEDDRPRDAIEHLTLALPSDADAPNAALVNYYLGNALFLDHRHSEADAALAQAADNLERRRSRAPPLPASDELLLVKTYTLRARVAQQQDNLAAAAAWGEQAAALRDGLVARAGEFERPVELHSAFAWLFAELTEIHRRLGDADAETTWRQQALDELTILTALSPLDDLTSLRVESAARFLIGDCTGSLEAIRRGQTVEPVNPDLSYNAAIVLYAQGRDDLAASEAAQMLSLRPEDPVLMSWLGNFHLQRGLRVGEFVEFHYIDRAEEAFRAVVAADPANLDARLWLAYLAELRAQAALTDLTATVNFDQALIQKSSALWRRDPARRDAALRGFSDEIDQRRMIALELLPGDTAARLELASAYASRAGVLYGGLPDLLLAGDTAQLSADGAGLLADVATIRELAEPMLAERSAASRLQRLRAWALLLDAIDKEWGWYAFFADDQEEGQRLLAEYERAVVDALAEIGDAPPADADEADQYFAIYAKAALIAAILHPDDAEWATYQQKLLELVSASLSQRSTQLRQTVTRCVEERLRREGDDFAARADYQAAIAHYQAALAINPRHLPALIGLAAALSATGDLNGAIARQHEAIATAPDLPVAWGNLGLYQLTAGDAEGATATYDRFLALARGLPPQERMALIRHALQELTTLAEGQPVARPAVGALLAQFILFLDSMAADGEGTFQYPALYAALGHLALVVDEAATAEPLLRRAISLDPHQPHARAMLAVAVIVQERDASREIDQAVDEALDPIWAEGPFVDPAALLQEMATSVLRYSQLFPARGSSLQPLMAAIADAQRQLKGGE